MEHAIARIDWGRWIADCPGGCMNAMLLQRGQETWECKFPLRDGQFGGCRIVAPIDWPDDPDAIEAELAGLDESLQQWRPAPPEEEPVEDVPAEASR